MRKISFLAMAWFAQILSGFAQDSSAYKSRKLSLSEVNFVSAYYTQNGDHSAVTGGIGTEKLNDISNTIELKFLKTDLRERKHSLNFELGIDHYSSASSDKIDPFTLSSPSHADTRIYPSLSYSVKNTNNLTLGANLSFSGEYDYRSQGIGFNIAKASADENREFSLKLQAYFDSWKVIYPIELRPAGYGTGGEGSGNIERKPRNSYSASLSYSFVVNTKIQLALLADLVQQTGLLATSYQRVYFKDASAHFEVLPDKRFKLPLGVRANFFLSPNFLLRSFYRFYTDNWGLNAHTLELETPLKLNPFFSVSPYYRFYMQNAAKYFQPYAQHASSEKYFTSDYDLSEFNSHFFGANFRMVPEHGVFHLQHWNTLELRYGHYMRNNNLNADIFTFNAVFK